MKVLVPLYSPLQRYRLRSHLCCGRHRCYHGWFAAKGLEDRREAIICGKGLCLHLSWHGEIYHYIAFELEGSFPSKVLQPDIHREVLGDLRAQFLPHPLREDL